MSQENFERFRELVLRDLSLQQRLREATDRHVFIQKIVEMSAECGYEITPEDVEKAMRRERRAWLERWI
ncbi:MAG TPA: Nif11-like leader peptide family natural product precursor [Pyrinomonadaceae bacterium]|jgi:predicted ribosomally synthesized peptide with nif11-like leader